MLGFQKFHSPHIIYRSSAEHLLHRCHVAYMQYYVFCVTCFTLSVRTWFMAVHILCSCTVHLQMHGSASPLYNNAGDGFVWLSL